jgi:hypothetical protein
MLKATAFTNIRLREMETNLKGLIAMLWYVP